MMINMTPFCHNSFVYHRPKVRVESAEVVIEFCENCKEEAIFTKSKSGSIDNNAYRIFHERDGLQGNHPRFEYEYEKSE